MIWLGLLFSVLSVVVPMITLTVGRSVVTYRLTGAEGARARRGSRVLLGVSALWSLSGLAQWLAWALPRNALWSFETVGIGFHLLPIALGWLPAVAFLIVTWPRRERNDVQPPRWVRWMDGLWMG
jgi:hypothetical protein